MRTNLTRTVATVAGGDAESDTPDMRPKGTR
jgi:hypothetical protein